MTTMSKNQENNIVKGLFFDLDGTLFDTDEANFLSYKKSFLQKGFEVNKSQFNEIKGTRSDYFIPILAPNITKDDIQDIKKYKSKFYSELIDKIPPNNELISFLATMRPHHKIALVSTASRENAIPILKKAKIIDLFDLLIFGGDVKNSKPDPESYNLALQGLNLRPDEVVAFEDSETGILAARNAGIRVIKVKI